MGQYLEQIPLEIQDHLKKITKTSGLPDTEDSVELLAEGWLEKKKIFEEEINNMNMEEVECLDHEDTRGALAMTYSGSLINFGPSIEGERKVGYASIGLRKDVPDMVEKDGCQLLEDINSGKIFEFKEGPVKKTSPIFKIIVCKENLNEEEQENKLKEVATIMIDDFVEVNKTIIIE